MEIKLKMNPDGSMQKAGRGPALFANAPHVYLDSDSAAPAFSAVSTYVAGNMVSYEHNTYICVFDKGIASDVTPDVDTQHWSRQTVIDYATGLIVSTVPYSIVGIAIENHAASLLDRTINRVDASSETGILTLTLPPETAGKSRDLYLAITCGATAPALSVLNATLRNSTGTAADLTLTASAITVLHFTETVNATTSPAVDPVFTVTGGMNGGPDNTKLNSTSAAPAFDATATYDVGSYVTYNGKLYRCKAAVATAGEWNAANWTADTMTDPDAVLDITSQNQLRVVAKDGTLLWAQGYDLASASSATLACDKGNNFTFADGATTQAFTLPTAPTGKVGDFILDIDNSANTVAATISFTDITNNTASVVVPKGENLNDMFSFAAGELAELYFTKTTFTVNNLPTWKVVKQVVENGGATV